MCKITTQYSRYFIVFFLLGSLVACHKKEKITAISIIQRDSINHLFKGKNISTLDSMLKKQGDKLDKGSLYFFHYNLGRRYRKKALFADAVVHHQTALSIAEELKDTLNIVKVANQLGTDYRRVGDMPNAAKAHFQALQFSEMYSKRATKEGQQLISFSLNGLGNIYKTMGLGRTAYSYFKRSSDIDEATGNYLGVAMNSVTLGSVLEHQNDLDSAYFYFSKAMHYDSLINSSTGIAICHNRMGQLQAKRGKLNDALAHYQAAKEILVEKKDLWNLLKTKNEIADIYITQKKYKEAEEILQNAKEKATKRKMYGYLAQSNYSLGGLYYKRKEYQAAAQSWKECIKNTDKVQKMRSEQKVIDSRVTFEREIGRRKIQDLFRANEEEKSRRKVISIASLIIYLLLFILLLQSYRLFRLQRKRNETLKESNKVRDKIFSIISHDLKAPAIAQKVAIENIIPGITNLKHDDFLSFCNVLRENTENQIGVIENLMHWTHLQTNRLQHLPRAVDIVPIIRDEIKLYQISASQKSINWEQELPSSCIVHVDRQMIAIVIRNLINNAVKFTNEGGNLKVVCRIKHNEAVVSVSDDGVGMTEEQIDALYTKEQNVKVRFGTKGEKGTGLGLILCKDLLERNHSRLLIESEAGKGTTIQFRLRKL